MNFLHRLSHFFELNSVCMCTDVDENGKLSRYEICNGCGEKRTVFTLQEVNDAISNMFKRSMLPPVKPETAPEVKNENEECFALYELKDTGPEIKCIFVKKDQATSSCVLYNESYKPRKFKVYPATITINKKS